MREFVDISKLTIEELDEIKHLSSALSITFDEALYKWMNKNPGRAKILGELKNGEIIKEDISEEGIKTVKGLEALSKIIKEALENNEERKESE